MQDSRDQDQHQEVQPDPNPNFDLPWNENQLCDFEGFSNAREDPQAARTARRIQILRQSACLLVEESFRTNVLSKPSRSGISPEDEIPPTHPQQDLELPGRLGDDPMGCFLPGGSSVVVRRIKSDPRGTTGIPLAGFASLYRRVGPRLGCDSGRESSLRSLVPGGTGSLHQFKRTTGSQEGPRRLPRPSAEPESGTVLRQYDCSIVPQKIRRYSFTHTERDVADNPTPMRGIASPSDASIRSRGPQCYGRRTQSGKSGAGCRVDPMSSGVQGHSEKVVGLSRPIRDPPQPSTPIVFLSGAGSSSHREGCDASGLGGHGSICLPSVCHDYSGNSEDPTVPQLHSHTHSPFLASKTLVHGPTGATSGGSDPSPHENRSSQTTPLQQTTQKPPSLKPDCMASIQLSARHAGFSSAVAEQLTLCRRKSTRMNYQAKWAVFRGWCRSNGHSISRPSIPKVADFLLYLRKKRNLSPSAISGFRSMLSAVFKFVLPEISSSQVLHDLLRSFRIERPRTPSFAPPWDLPLVLNFLRSEAFEPLQLVPLRELTKKVLFLVSLATARRVGELQAVSKSVSFSGEDIFLSYLPEFLAKTESEANPLPRSFVVRSIRDFAGDLHEELLLCPVRALRIYLKRTGKLKPHPRSLFVSPRATFRPISKNAISFFLREVISQAYAASPDPGPSVRPRAHSIRGMATSTAFARNLSISTILQAACWRSPSVFTSFYFKDIQFSHDEGFGLGPFVVANTVVP